MKLNVNKPIILFTFSIILILLVGVFSYYLYLMPLSNELDSKKNELQMTEQQVNILETKLKTTQTETKTNTMELQKKVPVKRLLEQALLQIEKAEIISDTNIIEMNINGTDSGEEVTNDELTTADQAIDDANKKEESNSNKEKNEQEVILPNGIHQTIIQIIGEASTYFELETFIDKLQSSERIMTIDTLNITGPTEIMSVEDSDQVIEFELAVSIYYYPTLDDLLVDVPPLETPKVSERMNPFDAGTLEKKEEEKEEP